MAQQQPSLAHSVQCDEGSRAHPPFADMFFALDASGRVITMHAEGSLLFPQPAPELIGQCAWDLLPEDVSAPLRAICEQVSATGMPGEVRVYHAPAACWWDVRVYPGQESISFFCREFPAQRAGAALGNAELLPAAVSVAFDPLILLADTRILDVNASCAALFQRTPEEMLNRSLFDLVIPEDRAGLAQQLADRSTGVCAYRACRQDGRVFLLEAQVTSCVSDGRTLQLLALRDNTIHKAAELMAATHMGELDYLSRSALTFLEPMSLDALYEYIGTQVLTLANSAIVAVFTYDPLRNESVVKTVHGPEVQLAALGRMLGFSLPGATIPMSELALTLLSRHEGRLEHFEEFTTLFANPAPIITEKIIDRLDIKAWYLFPLLIDKQPLGWVTIAMLGQVTPQNPYLITALLNQASIALQRYRAEAALERERAYLSTAIDMLPLPVSFIAPDGTAQRRNVAMQAFLDKFGVRNELDWQYFDPITHVQALPEQHPLYRALQGHVTDGKEMLLATADIQRLPALVYAAPIHLADKVVATVFAVQDISELKEADQAKDEFLAVLSHELRTPLTSILGWSELIHQTDDSVRYRQSMEVINRNALRIKELVTELLDMSRIIHRKLTIFPEHLDLREQLRQAVENIQCEAQQQQISLLITTQSATPLLAPVDPLRLQQCLGNLLHNSLKFTPTGGAITISSAQDRGWGVVTISDTGCGIAPELLNKIFDPFTQLHREMTAEGLGLGLAMVRGIIALHHGDIMVTSPGEGFGCTFTIRLPLSGEFES